VVRWQGERDGGKGRAGEREGKISPVSICSLAAEARSGNPPIQWT